MTILFFGAYDPSYSRNRVLLRGFHLQHTNVVECNGGTSGGILKFLKLIWRYLKLGNKHFDLIVVAFPAQEAMLIAGVLFFFRRALHKTPVVVDMLTSHYDGYILNRKRYSPKSLHARWYWWIDRIAVGLADCAIVDSDASGRFFAEEFGIPSRKLMTVFIGTDDSIMKPSPQKPEGGGQFLVHFHGNLIPHQGVEYLIKAANILREEDIVFQIIGRGQDYARCRKLADDLQLSNIRWIDPVPYERLPDFINKADICIGPLGGTSHFDRCAPNKIYEYMACGKPIIIGRSRALERIAREGINMLLSNPADENDCAEKIRMVKHDPVLRQKLGENAYRDFIHLYTPQRLVAGFFDGLRQRKIIPISA